MARRIDRTECKLRCRSVAGGELGHIIEITFGGWCTIQWDRDGEISDIHAALSRGIVELV